MLFTPVIAAAILATSANAAPIAEPGLLSSILGLLTTPIDQVLSSLGITLQTNYNIHGPTFVWPAIPKVSLSSVRFPHVISWPKGCSSNSQVFIDWKTFKANGANLGSWLEKEQTHDFAWYVSPSITTSKTSPSTNPLSRWQSVDPTGTSADEWSLCQNLGSNCAPIFEARYASYLNTSSIDKLASIGVNTLRIPTTYAAWINFPGSQLYHGNQQTYLRTITNYAITKYNMHIIIGLHSLPGGVNGLDIGEAFGHDDWFYNSTNLDWSFKAIDAVLAFMKSSGHLNAFTLAPINEASDTHLAGFGSPAGLTANGTNYINTYMAGVLKKIAAVDTRIPLMLQDCFQGESFWAPFYDASTNIVIDSHFYWFAAAGAYSQYVSPAICGEASAATDGKFPVFVGEWSLQTMYNNTFAGRKELYDTQRYAWQHYLSGSAFWNWWSDAPAAVDGQGSQKDYWSLVDLIDEGVATLATNASYC